MHRKVKCYTITEGMDWGPAITKLVLEFQRESEIGIDNLKITSVRSIPNETTNIFRSIEMLCDVNAIYQSDKFGNRALDGKFLTLSLEVGPERIENSPFHYRELMGRNIKIGIDYRISFEYDSVMFEAELVEDIKLVSSDFFHNSVWEEGNIKLHYASYKPQIKSKDKVPLIIWLHGAGEGGLDTEIPVLGNKVTSLAKALIQSKFGENGAYVLVPQSPTMWMDLNGETVYNIDVKGSDGQSIYQDALMSLIDQYVCGHPEIDKKRIYLGGCSNGGYMTVQMLINFPNYFAAAFPIAEAYHVDWLNDERIEILKEVPLWLVHSKDDPVIPIHKDYVGPWMEEIGLEYDSDDTMIDHFSNALYKRLSEKGAKNVHYSLFNHVVDTSGKHLDHGGNPYKYNGHFSWIYVFNDLCFNEENEGLFEWLSKQSL